MTRIPLIAIAALAALSGCATEKPAKSAYPSTNPDNVKVYQQVPKHPFEILGPVSFEGAYTPHDAGSNRLALGDKYDLLVELRDQAAALGADAVILKEKDVYESFDPSGKGGNNPGDGRRIRLSGVAIRYTRPAAH
jgi:hypothetical protein